MLYTIKVNSNTIELACILLAIALWLTLCYSSVCLSVFLSVWLIWIFLSGSFYRFILITIFGSLQRAKSVSTMAWNLSLKLRRVMMKPKRNKMVIFVNKTGLDLFRDNYWEVSIGLLGFSFVSFSYNGVYFLQLNVAPFLFTMTSLTES